MRRRVILREALHRQLADHLTKEFGRGCRQEEACLALWRLGDGFERYTGVLGEVIPPGDHDRRLHGGVTIRGGYLSRATDLALSAKAGVAVLHSHPERGWQRLSRTDEETERNIIAPFVRETGLPLLGLTISSDRVWSARYWPESKPGRIRLAHCAEVRRVGPRHSAADWHPSAHPEYRRRRSLVRTLHSWGRDAQARLARTHLCVVGAGSVGSIVLEILARTGFEEITIIDPDTVEESNLDRLVYADRLCLGLPKAELAAERVRSVSTARRPIVRPVPLSIGAERAYRLAADADVIVSCVDNAEAREVLNHISYANCLPLIDGGVRVDSGARLHSAKWRAHLVGPDMQCLRCRGQYTTGDARDERSGIRLGGRYINGDDDGGRETGQNTMVFCSMVAAEIARMLVRYLIGEPWWHDQKATAGQWAFEHRFVEAESEPFEHPGQCVGSCEFAHQRLGLARAGRPPYPFLEDGSDGWRTRVAGRLRAARMRLNRAVAALRN